MSVLFVLLLVGQSFAALKDTTVSSKTYKVIATCENLVEFSRLVNTVVCPSGYDYVYGDNKCQKIIKSEASFPNAGLNAIVTGPIDMTCTENFEPMGYENSGRQYVGNFNGQGYPIRNLKIDSDDQNVALFGVITTEAVIENVVLENVEIKATGIQERGGSRPISVGTIVAWQEDGTVSGCYASGSIVTDGLAQSVGGITGYATAGTIKDCLSSVEIHNLSNASFVGGVAGTLSNAKIERCVYGGNGVYNAGDGTLGGLVGQKNGGTGSIANSYYDNKTVDKPVGNEDNGSGSGVGLPDVNTSETVENLNEGCGEKCIWSNGSDNITNTGISNDNVDNTVYTIYFAAGTGCAFPSGAITSKALKFDSPITSTGITEPVCDEKKFLGWSLNASATKPDESLGKVFGSSTVYAVWEDYVTVTFHSNGGKFAGDKTELAKKVAKQSVIVSSDIEIPSRAPEGTGEDTKYFSFKGWALTSDAVDVQSLGAAEGDVNVYAVWEETKIVYYSVIYDVNGHGETPAIDRVKEHSTAFRPEDPIADGYKFDGWYTSADGKGLPYDFEKTVLNDLKLYAKWVPVSYAILYELGENGVNNIANPVSYTIESANIILQIPSRDGYDFIGWYDNADFNGEAIKTILTGSFGDKKFYAKWSVKSYYVYYAEGTDGVGEVPAAQLVNHGDSVKLAGKVFTRNVYKCDKDGKNCSVQTTVNQIGWSLSDGGKKFYDLESYYKGNASVTLYPAWDESALTLYAVTFKIVGAASTEAAEYLEARYLDVSSASDVNVKYPTMLIHDGYEITKVSSSDVTLDTKTTSFVMPKKNVVVTIDVAPKKYKLAWNLEGGSVATAGTAAGEVSYGTSLDAPVVEKEHYTFSGWNPSVPETMPAENVSYTAVWTEKTIDVTVNLGGNKITVTVSEDASKDEIEEKINELLRDPNSDLKVPEKPSDDDFVYEFNGHWKEDGGEYVPEYDAISREDQNIHVVVGGSQVDVTVRKDDSKETVNQKINDAVKDDGIVVPAKDGDGYKFNGEWEQDKDGNYVPVYDVVTIKVVVAGKEIDIDIKKGDSADDISDKINDALAEAAKTDPAVVVPAKDEAGRDFNGKWEDADGDDKYTPVYVVPDDSKVIEVVVGKDTIEVVVPKDASDEEVEQKISEVVTKPVVGDKDEDGYQFNGEWEQNKDGAYEPVYEKTVQAEVAGKDIPVDIKKGDSADDISDKINDALAEAAKTDPAVVVPAKDEAGRDFNGKWEDADGDDKYTPVYVVPDDSKVIEVVVGKDTIEVVVPKDASDEEVEQKINEVVTKPVVGDKDEDGYQFNGEWEQDKDGNYEPVYEKTVQAEVAGKDIPVDIKKGDSADDISDKINDAVAEVAKTDPAVVVPAKDEAGRDFNGKWEDADGDDKYTPVYVVPDDSKVIEVVVGKDTIEVVVPKDASDEEVEQKIEEVVTKPVVGDKDEDGFQFNGEWEQNKDGAYEPVYEKTVQAEVAGKDIPVDIKKGDSADDISDKINDAVAEAAKTDPTVVVPAKDEAGRDFNGKWEDADGDDKYTPVYVVPDDSKVIEVVVGKDTIEVVVPKDASDEEIKQKIEETLNNHDPKIEVPESEDGFEFNGEWKKDDDGNYVPVYEKEIVVVIGNTTISVVIDRDDSDDDVNQKINDAVAEISKKDSSIVVPVVGDKDSVGNEFDGKWEKDEYGNYVPVYSKAYKIVYVMPSNAVLSSDVSKYVLGKGVQLPSASIKDDESWKFMGWYETEDYAGLRVKFVGAEAKGRKTFYALFQKTVHYKAGDVSGKMEVVFNYDVENSDEVVQRALMGVAPEGYTKKGVDYVFDKWVLSDGVYVAKFVDASTGMKNIAVARHFGVSVSGRTLNIVGAKQGDKMLVVDMKGKIVAQDRISGVNHIVELTSAGNYLVRVNGVSTRVMVR
ncbi:InlB B-repeat-containing protein [Fibrobacter sp. HC4]|uniref:InlB B-repeat-containing protein n=1 Tax=Fibrobacter sp. HC4 TaxID=3239812 RepID=UPI002018B33C|nr:InlB B-repeat-containing protein [Fibrobacter succinogenes]